jgi:hypothetical protein
VALPRSRGRRVQLPRTPGFPAQPVEPGVTHSIEAGFAGWLASGAAAAAGFRASPGIMTPGDTSGRRFVPGPPGV